MNALCWGGGSMATMVGQGGGALPVVGRRAHMRTNMVRDGPGGVVGRKRTTG